MDQQRKEAKVYLALILFAYLPWKSAVWGLKFQEPLVQVFVQLKAKGKCFEKICITITRITIVSGRC